MVRERWGGVSYGIPSIHKIHTADLKGGQIKVHKDFVSLEAVRILEAKAPCTGLSQIYI